MIAASVLTGGDQVLFTFIPGNLWPPPGITCPNRFDGSDPMSGTPGPHVKICFMFEPWLWQRRWVNLRRVGGGVQGEFSTSTVRLPCWSCIMIVPGSHRTLTGCVISSARSSVSGPLLHVTCDPKISRPLPLNLRVWAEAGGGVNSLFFFFLLTLGKSRSWLASSSSSSKLRP